MRVFKTKWFTRYARRERISDHSLVEAIQRAERGIVDADLGGGVIKQRVARAGQGRSSGYRVLVAYRSGERAVFSSSTVLLRTSARISRTMSSLRSAISQQDGLRLTTKALNAHSIWDFCRR